MVKRLNIGNIFITKRLNTLPKELPIKNINMYLPNQKSTNIRILYMHLYSKSPFYAKTPQCL